MPPRLPPITAAQAPMPSRSASRACASTQSSTVTSGKSRAPRLAGRGIDRRRAGRAEAAAEIVDADDEEAVGVERLARADHVVPPADVVGVVGVTAGDVVRRVERVADQHRVRARGVQRAVGLVGELVRRQRAPARGSASGASKRATLRHDDADGAGRPAARRRSRAAGGGGKGSHGSTTAHKKPDQPSSRVSGCRNASPNRFSHICNAPASWLKSARAPF